MRTSNVVLGYKWLIGAALSSSLVFATFGMSGCSEGMPGQSGPTGQPGPAGAVGPTGPMGETGTMGTMGTMGTNGITASRRAFFDSVDVGKGSPAGTMTNLLAALPGGNLTFTTPATTPANSEAVLTSSGFCLLSADSVGGTDIIQILPTLTGSTGTLFGQVQVEGTFTATQAIGYSTMTIAPVAASTQYTATLQAKKITSAAAGTVLDDYCHGNVTVQIFNQQMAP